MPQFKEIEDLQERMNFVENCNRERRLKDFIREEMKLIENYLERMNPDFAAVDEICQAIIRNIVSHDKNLKEMGRKD